MLVHVMQTTQHESMLPQKLHIDEHLSVYPST